MNSPITYLNSNDETGILAFGEGPFLRIEEKNSLQDIQDFIDLHIGEYIFSNLSYDLKNIIENLQSNNTDNTNFPLAIFWVPKTVVKIENNIITYVQGSESNESEAFIQSFLSEKNQSEGINNFQLTPRTDKESYLSQVKALKNEIQLGNIYEVNYCQEFYSNNVDLTQPIRNYFKLNELTKAPFSCYSKLDEFEVLSGSPERYIQKKGNKIISQPIKGTQKRGESVTEDQFLINKLKSDPKERAENVMIVDLVRNDLSRIALPKTVKVDELFGIYSFKTVHQMISTISCEIDSSTRFVDILKATYPMGSMTGAPKLNAMKFIEKHENFKRGIYSGSIGYIAPNGDFDFNVIIRSMVYNRTKKYLSCSVGGAITAQSIPQSEYEECFTKVNAILKEMHA